ncbi:MAG: AI-2E family transporter [bacterium]
MKTEHERLSILLFYAYVLLLGFLAFQILRPFLMPLAWAGVLALCLWPLFNKLAARWGNNRAAGAMTLLAAVLIIGPAVWIGITLVEQASQVVAEIQKTLALVENQDKFRNLWARVGTQVPLPPLGELRGRITEWAGTLTSAVAGQAAGIIQNVTIVVFKTVITFFALFFFLRDGGRAPDLIRSFLPFRQEQQDTLIKQTRELIFSGITATLVIAFAQGCVGGIIFAILGIKAPVFWGLCMGFCALIPVVGTSLIWGPAAVSLMVDGQWVQGVILLGCGIGVIGMLDNIFRPLLLQGKTTMNGLLMFLSILGGLAAFGFIGLILGPVVMAATVSLTGMLTEGVGESVKRDG